MFTKSSRSLSINIFVNYMFFCLEGWISPPSFVLVRYVSSPFLGRRGVP